VEVILNTNLETEHPECPAMVPLLPEDVQWENKQAKYGMETYQKKSAERKCEVLKPKREGIWNCFYWWLHALLRYSCLLQHLDLILV